eukprot:8590991-Karenia_brevis.AAC.1
MSCSKVCAASVPSGGNCALIGVLECIGIGTALLPSGGETLLVMVVVQEEDAECCSGVGGVEIAAVKGGNLEPLVFIVVQ